MTPPRPAAPPPVQLVDAAKLPKPPTKPRGGSGTIASNGYVQTREVLSEWTGTARYRTADQMYRSDPTVRAALLMVLLPIVEAEWTVSPASEDEEDRAAAELVRRALLEHLDWSQVLWDVASPALRYGHGLVEETYEAVEWSLIIGEGDEQTELPKRPWWVPRQYGPRLPHTIQRWNLDDEGQLVSVEQTIAGSPGRQEHVVIPADSLVLWTNEKEGDDPTGTSLLRCMYRSWYAKDKLEVIDAIRAERAGVGLPLFWTGEYEDDADAMEAAGVEMRANEKGAMVLKGTKGTEGAQHFEMADMRAASTADVQASLQYHVTQILWGVLGAWQTLGHGEVGARATATVQDDPFYLLLRYFAGRLASVWQRQVIPRLVAFNFPTDRLPTIQVGELQGVDLAAFTQALAAAMTAGAITSDEELEAHVRRIMGLPEKSVEDEPEEEESPPPPPPGEEPPADPEDDVPPLPGTEDTDDPSQPQDRERDVPVREHERAGRPVRDHGRSKPKRSLRQVLADLLRDELPAALALAAEAPATPQYWREPTALEREHVLLSQISGVIESQRQEYERLAEPAVLRVAEYLAGNLLANDPGTPLAPIPRALVDDLEQQLRTILTRTASFGRVSVRSELESQAASARGLTRQDPPRDVDHAVQILAARPPKDPDKLDAWLRKRAAASADAITRRLESTADAVALRTSPTAIAEVAASRLSSTARAGLRAQAVATVAQSLSAGRQAETREAAAAGLIDHAEYSAILDANCCGPCRELDGETYTVDSEEYERDYPPLYACDGADACRCMMVVVGPEVPSLV